jgi:L-lactate dehydrogenase complex protein LldF
VSFPLDARALRALPDGESLARHDSAVHRLRGERDRALASVPDLEALRDRAAALKAHTLDHLDHYLEEFEARARERGAVVHWAGDAAAHNRIVAGILAARSATRVVKSKSMLTEECGLNGALEARGVEVVDTDLGERIVQLGGEPPSHIVVPAIHRRREEVGVLFQRHLGTPPGETDPARLMAAARADLRARFLGAQAAITGVNFAVAETGTLVVVTNEGNADLGMSLPPLHVASLGIEKVIPALDDLAVFLRLLARSATGQALSVYTSLVTGPRPGGELHVVIVDGGRTRLLASPGHRSALRCIRCGACLNTCPVYRRAGGHAYATSVAGPIGAVLAPALAGTPEARALPYASSLCGSCTAVCPVRIDLHGQLLAWRREAPALPSGLRLAARIAGAVFARPWAFRAAGRALRRFWPLLERSFPGNPAGAWLERRALPVHPGRSFAELWRARAATREARAPREARRGDGGRA